MFASLHNVKNIELTKIRVQINERNDKVVYVRTLTIESDEGSRFQLTLFSNERETLKLK